MKKEKNCRGCESGCITETNSDCVVWFGKELPKIDMGYLDRLTCIIEGIYDLISDHIDESVVDASCLGMGTVTKSNDALQKLILDFCSLDAKDISFSGDISCDIIKMSTSAKNLIGSTVEVITTPGDQSSGVSWNIRKGLNITGSQQLISSNVKIYGNDQEKQMSVLLANSDQPIGSINVAPNKFPVTMMMEATVSTVDGIVTLNKTVTISNPSKGTQSLHKLKIYNQGSVEITTVEDAIESMGAAICELHGLLMSYSNIDIEDCEEYIIYNDTDIVSIVLTHAAVLCDIMKRLEDLETVTIEDCDSECEETMEMSIQEAFDFLMKKICALEDRVTELENENTSLNNQISTISSTHSTSKR